MRWRIILPTLGLLLFALEAWQSNRDWRSQSTSRQYFYWSSTRLDPDPLNRDPRFRKAGGENSGAWDLQEIAEPDWLAISSMLSGLPAFLLGMAMTAALSRLGISQVLTFMISTPILLFAWYYFLGWLLDRWRRKSPRGPVNT